MTNEPSARPVHALITEIDRLNAVIERLSACLTQSTALVAELRARLDPVKAHGKPAVCHCGECPLCRRRERRRAKRNEVKEVEGAGIQKTDAELDREAAEWLGKERN